MRFPIIKVKDNYSGHEHIVGTNSHDMLCINEGLISYYNLQNGDGSTYGAYAFTGTEEDEMFGVTVEFVTFDELKQIHEKENKRAIERELMLKDMVDKIINDRE